MREQTSAGMPSARSPKMHREFNWKLDRRRSGSDAQTGIPVNDGEVP